MAYMLSACCVCVMVGAFNKQSPFKDEIRHKLFSALIFNEKSL